MMMMMMPWCIENRDRTATADLVCIQEVEKLQ